MVKIRILGIEVDFPFKPHKPQIITMSKMIEAFLNGKSSMVESPTGTGKSLAILCAALGFLEFSKKKENLNTVSPETVLEAIQEAENKKAKTSSSGRLNKIFVCSRTHKQLDQLIAQLQMTKYRPTMTILGSKDQYCINSKALKTTDLETNCKNLIKRGACIFYKGKDQLKKNVEHKIFDIGEMKRVGTLCSGCPYYTSKDLIETADVIFAPYNYLISPQIRKSMLLSIENSIIIIDEAHNLEDVCRSAGSLEVSSKILEITINDLAGAIKKAEVFESISVEFNTVLSYLLKFVNYAKKFTFPAKFKSEEYQETMFKGKEMMDLLNKMDLTEEHWLNFKGCISRIKNDKDVRDLPSIHTWRFLEELEFVINSILIKDCYDYAFAFKKKTKSQTEEYCYNFWLLNAQDTFSQISKKAMSLVLLSGTLTLFDQISTELGHSFYSCTSAPHILKSSQIFVASINKVKSGNDLCGTYKIAITAEYQNEIVSIILLVANSVKHAGGTIVFLSSYNFLSKIHKILMHKIDKNKSMVVIEPQTGGNRKFEIELKKYTKSLEVKDIPSIMLCVHRGKAAEGLDFKDHYARAVISVGIPYPAIKDPLINLKMEWNDTNFGKGAGRKWYSTQAFKALKQSMGRTIRHTSDWGVLYLIDSRFQLPYIQKELPGWVQENARYYKTFAESESEMVQFVKNKSINF